MATQAFDFQKFYLSTEGRVSRKNYWMKLILPIVVIAIMLQMVLGAMLGQEQASNLMLIFNVIILWPSIAVGAKRFHDRNKSGWWLLLGLIPLIGSIWLLIELGFLKGTDGKNQYGTDPTK